MEFTHNNTPCFVTRMSVEDERKQSNEVTKNEIAKLLEKINNNPALIMRRKFEYDSDDSSSDDDTKSSKSSTTSSSSSSTSSSSSDDSTDKESLHIFKKNLEIDSLEKQLHYKTLEMTNLMIDKSKMEKELSTIKEKYESSANLIKIIEDFFTVQKEFNEYIVPRLFKKEPSCIFSSTRDAKFFRDLMKIEKTYDGFLTHVDTLEKELNKETDSLTKEWLTEELSVLKEDINETMDEVIGNYTYECKYNKQFIIAFVISVLAMFYFYLMNAMA